MTFLPPDRIRWLTTVLISLALQGTGCALSSCNLFLESPAASFLMSDAGTRTHALPQTTLQEPADASRTDSAPSTTPFDGGGSPTGPTGLFVDGGGVLGSGADASLVTSTDPSELPSSSSSSTPDAEAEAVLLDIAFSAGVLEPPFNVQHISYHIELPVWVERVGVQPILSAPGAVRVNDTTFAGSPVVIELGLEPTQIVIEGPSSTTYVVEVDRRASTNRVEVQPLDAKLSGDLDLDLDGDVLVVGEANRVTTPGGDAGAEIRGGGVYVFERGATTWTQSAVLEAHNPDHLDLFGRAVAISGGAIVVGAFFEQGSGSGVNPPDDDESPAAGAAYVFERVNGAWSQTAYLKALLPSAADWFGYSVDIDGDRIAVGAISESSSYVGVDPPVRDTSKSYSGAAYIFERRNGEFAQTAYFKASVSERGDQFGASVAVASDTVVVGAFGEGGNAPGVNGDPSLKGLSIAGAAYVFGYDRAEDTWRQEAYLKSSDPQTNAEFGRAVAADGNRVAVGAPGEIELVQASATDGGLSEVVLKGAVYVFANDEGWYLEDRIEPEDPIRDAEFGAEVALRGDVLAVSSAERMSLYVRNGDRWIRREYLPDSPFINIEGVGGLAFDGMSLATSVRRQGVDLTIHLLE